MYLLGCRPPHTSSCGLFGRTNGEAELLVALLTQSGLKPRETSIYNSTPDLFAGVVVNSTADTVVGLKSQHVKVIFCESGGEAGLDQFQIMRQKFNTLGVKFMPEQ